MSTENAELAPIIAVADATMAGAITYWRLASAPTDPRELRRLWLAAGLDAGLLPSLPEPETALRRAVGEQKAARRLVRPTPKKDGYIIVNESATGNDLDWNEELRVKLNKVGQVVTEPTSHPKATELRASYEEKLNELTEGDISTWIVQKLVPAVGGVGLRPTGGIYFIPRPQVEKWKKMTSALMLGSGHVVFQIPAMTSAEALDAVIDAVVQEAETEAQVVEAEMMKGDLGKRALESRVTRTEAVEAKIETYEGLLGRKLDALHARLKKLRAGLTVAIISAEGSAAAEVAAL